MSRAPGEFYSPSAVERRMRSMMGSDVLDEPSDGKLARLQERVVALRMLFAGTKSGVARRELTREINSLRGKITRLQAK